LNPPDDAQERVQAFYDAIEHLPGVRSVEMQILQLDSFSVAELQQPGEMQTLPQVLLRRTQGGLPGERLISTEIVFDQTHDGWISLEFLAWWVQDLARTGVNIQLRPLAEAPRGIGLQLGRTLKFVLEIFLIEPDSDDDFTKELDQLLPFAEKLQAALHEYGPVLDQPTARDWNSLDELKTYADRGDAQAMLEYAMIIAPDAEELETDTDEEEASQPGDPAAAFEYLIQAAELGHPIAAAFAGIALAEGNGIPQDPAKAVALYEKAIQGGFSPAMTLLGMCYRRGSGVEQDAATAVRWFQKGIEANEVPCLFALAECYEEGFGVPQNLAEAVRLYELVQAKNQALPTEERSPLAELPERLARLRERLAEPPGI